MVMLRRLLRDTRASAGAEFALVLPLLLISMFTVIDGGRYMWAVNMAEKATQAGARFAVVTSPVAGGLADSTVTFIGFDDLAQGDRIPASDLGTITCTSTSCTGCDGCPTGLPGTYNGTAFANIVARMHYYDPSISASNVTVEYRGSGIGFAGDPNPPEAVPLVTVKLNGLTFQPLSTFLFASIPMPSFSTTLTAEDLSGTTSN
jgi:Flp pilus assembly protein TadG